VRDTMAKALEQAGIKVVADVSTDAGQVDFSGAVLKVKQSNADAVFVYTNEEESARALREFKKQGYDKPIIGETTLTGQKVIELAGDAANGAVAHVGLTVDAPQPGIKGVRREVPEGIQVQERPQRHEGLQRHVRRQGDHEKTRSSIRRTSPSAARREDFGQGLPGVLLDVSFDSNGDLDRESFLVKVENGKQVVTTTLPPASASRCGHSEHGEGPARGEQVPRMKTHGPGLTP
jgi:branched-chain amino acid transport system substrate-binding protein